MLNDGSGFKKVYLATGFTDLRRGIDGLARIIRFQFQLDPYDGSSAINRFVVSYIIKYVVYLTYQTR